MGKTKITYRCGHTEIINLFGKMSERDKTEQYYKTIDCPHCRAAEAVEKSGMSGIPRLTGSDKQILWATTIRNKAIVLINKSIDNMSERGLSVDLQKQLRDKWIVTETESEYWISNREDLNNLHGLSKLLLKYKSL